MSTFKTLSDEANSLYYSTYKLYKNYSKQQIIVYFGLRIQCKSKKKRKNGKTFSRFPSPVSIYLFSCCFISDLKDKATKKNVD